MKIKKNISIKTNLEPGWRDKDEVLAIVIMQLLIDFVEQEDPYNFIDIEGSSNKADWVRLRELYEKSKLYMADPEIFDDLEEGYHELTDHLVEIVKLRKMLWT